MNWWQWVRSLIQLPVAIIHSPADHGGMANQSDAMASELNPNDAKAVFRVLVSDALDQPRQHLAVGRLGLDLHEPPSLG